MKFELINIDFDTQWLRFRIHHPIRNGWFVMRDIDLGTTMYAMPIWDVNPGLELFYQPTPKFVFDFNREDFGGFEFQLVEDKDVIESQFMRLRYTNLITKRMDIKDYFHPIFLNYREFFVDDMYKEFDLENCKTVIDAGASVGLFTRYMLKKGAENIISIEPAPRSILALQDNFFNRDRVKVIPKALAGELKSVTLNFKSDNLIVSSLDKEGSDFRNYDDHETVEVETTTVEQVFNNSGWDEIDLLKLDIEGSEYEVIDTLSPEVLIRTNKILLEFHWQNGRLNSIINKLTQYGFNFKFLSGCDIESDFGNIFFFK